MNDELARKLILEGKGWHDEDGPTIVDSIDPDEGKGYPVHYHWTSGGAGADSIAGFVSNNYLPMQETIRIAADFVGEARAQLAAERDTTRRLREALERIASDDTSTLLSWWQCRSLARAALTSPAPGTALDPAYTKECVCPFPRLTCPGCTEACRACAAAYMDQQHATPAAPQGTPTPVLPAQACFYVRDGAPAPPLGCQCTFCSSQRAPIPTREVCPEWCGLGYSWKNGPAFHRRNRAYNTEECCKAEHCIYARNPPTTPKRGTPEGGKP